MISSIIYDDCTDYERVITLILGNYFIDYLPSSFCLLFKMAQILLTAPVLLNFSNCLFNVSPLLLKPLQLK